MIYFRGLSQISTILQQRILSCYKCINKRMILCVNSRLIFQRPWFKVAVALLKMLWKLKNSWAYKATSFEQIKRALYIQRNAINYFEPP